MWWFDSVSVLVVACPDKCGVVMVRGIVMTFENSNSYPNRLGGSSQLGPSNPFSLVHRSQIHCPPQCFWIFVVVLMGEFKGIFPNFEPSLGRFLCEFQWETWCHWLYCVSVMCRGVAVCPAPIDVCCVVVWGCVALLCDVVMWAVVSAPMLMPAMWCLWCAWWGARCCDLLWWWFEDGASSRCRWSDKMVVEGVFAKTIGTQTNRAYMTRTRTLPFPSHALFYLFCLRCFCCVTIVIRIIDVADIVLVQPPSLVSHSCCSVFAWVSVSLFDLMWWSDSVSLLVVACPDERGTSDIVMTFETHVNFIQIFIPID